MALPDRARMAAGTAFVHYCPFCGWHAEMASPTIVVPKCRECGCTVSSCSHEDYARVRQEAKAARFVPPPVHDGSSVLAAILIALLVLPAAGAKLGDFVFLAPLVVMV